MTDTPQRLTDKVALITGGGRGIGAAIVRRLAAEGARVAINYHSSADTAEALATELGGPERAIAIKGDVNDPQASRDLVAATVTAFGGLDILVSNAGVEYFGPLASITPEDFQRVFGTNVAGQLFAAQAAAAAMKPGGKLVLTSSVSAQLAVFQHSLYAASKAAVSAMVRNLAPELAGQGLTINAIAPGGTQTDMAAENAKNYLPPSVRDLPEDQLASLFSSMGRLGRPDEIAAAVAFLVSDDASYVSGSTLDVDGGH